MYNKKRNVIFCHVPKCCGTSVRRSIDGDFCGIPHVPISHDFKLYKNASFSFAFARNPWDRFVSAFHYLNAGGLGNQQDRMYQKTYFQKHNGCFNSFIKSRNFMQVLHFKPISFYLDDLDKIDFIGRFENLQNDFNYICEKLSIPSTEILHIRKSKHKHYKDYYNEETAAIVEEIYNKDIELFGYKFEGS